MRIALAECVTYAVIAAATLQIAAALAVGIIVSTVFMCIALNATGYLKTKNQIDIPERNPYEKRNSPKALGAFKSTGL